MSQPEPTVADRHTGKALVHLADAARLLSGDDEQVQGAQAKATMAQAEATLALGALLRELIAALAPAVATEADPLEHARERMARDRVIATRLGPGVRE